MRLGKPSKSQPLANFVNKYGFLQNNIASWPIVWLSQHIHVDELSVTDFISSAKLLGYCLRILAGGHIHGAIAFRPMRHHSWQSLSTAKW